MTNVQVKEILVEAFPDEVDLLGDELVDDLLGQEATSGHLNLPGDDRFDLAPVYDFLKYVSVVVEYIIRNLNECKGQDPKTVVEIAIGDRKLNMATSNPEIEQQIADNVSRLIDLVEAGHRSRKPD